jgi:hypothetical protein
MGKENERTETCSMHEWRTEIYTYISCKTLREKPLGKPRHACRWKDDLKIDLRK